MKFKIGQTLVGDNQKCFIVAEMSGNHNGNFNKACEIVRLAKKAGADAIKLQTYKPSTITLNSKKKDFIIKNKSPWKKKKTFWKLYEEAQTPWEWHPKLFKLAKKIGIEIFSSPFDETAVDFLEKINCSAYKIASPEINHIPLIEKIAQTKKPIIISTGLCSKKDINLALQTIKKYKNNKIIILKCTSSYPANPEELNLVTIKDIKKRYNVLSGFSDHTKDDTAALTSVAIGAKVLEKHFKTKNYNSVDDFFSMDNNDFKTMIKKIRFLEKSLGKIDYNPSKSAKLNHYIGRRSIYVCKPIKKNEVVTKYNIKIVRPNFGLHPKYYYDIIGKKVNKNLLTGARFKISYVK
ncbi:pseudaminic acid synthase [Candidatus Pelagibacter sp.]|nr:pseudaminic acid synthase [Candidatus Pelagibacter sp.]